MVEITFVTGNEKKWAEIQAILGREVTLRRANLDLLEVQGASIEEIATAKCREAAKLVGGAVITEDTALSFDALGGLPGAYIKWFVASVGLDGLNDMLIGFGDRTGARAICTMAYCSGPDAEPQLFQGITAGKIVRPRGPLHFGWDPIFQPAHPSGLTYAEMSAELKNTLSHRYKALQLLKSHLEQQ